MFPEGFLQRVVNQKYIDSDALLLALQQPAPVSIRINTAKWNRRPLNGDPVPWCATGSYLESRPSFTLDPLFHSGCYYPQEASSMFLEQAFRQTTGLLKKIRVLDLCGAPGGKSTHLSDIIGPDNLLVANEVIRSRSLVLAETITKWGSDNTIVTQNDPAVFGRLQGYFDVIMVDAPCSGEGMFRNCVAINEWSVENTTHCSERQKRIIVDVWPALKENGILIYSTCTFNPGENEENLKWFLGNHEAECLRLNIKDFKGITEIDYQGIYGYGFYPDKIKGEGFFISVIRKTGRQQKVQVRNQRKPELIPGKTDFNIANKLTNFEKDRLLKWGDEIIAVPFDMADYIHLFQNLRIVKAGTKLFNVKKNDYIPSHELALSNQLRKDAYPVEEIDYERAVSYMRRDVFQIPDAMIGWNLVTYKNVNVGFVKNIGKRVNNYFPVEWRIRLSVTDTKILKPLTWQ